MYGSVLQIHSTIFELKKKFSADHDFVHIAIHNIVVEAHLTDLNVLATVYYKESYKHII